MNALDDLLQVTQLRYQQQQAAFGKLMAEEAALRAELARLNEMLHTSFQPGAPEMRSIGADVIWQSWVGRVKTELNMRLARVLAQKENHIRQVRIAFGKMMVSEDLIEQRNTEKKRSVAQRELSNAIDQSLAKLSRSQ